METEIDFARSILNHSQTLINLVDTKAGILLATDGGILAILGAFPPGPLAPYQMACLIAAVTLVGVSALMGAMTIKARRVKGTPATKIFFGTVLEKARDEYIQSFPSSQQEILDDYLNNVYTLALIQKAKFAFLNRSLYFLLTGLVPLVVLVISTHTN